MLRSVDGGGEVDLDKRAITGDDDIIELDQLRAQNAEPRSAHARQPAHTRSGSRRRSSPKAPDRPRQAPETDRRTQRRDE